MTVSGFPWCLDTSIAIGLNSFTRNALCGAHNNALSKVDDAGIAVFHALRPAAATGSPISSVSVSGRLFERWLLKTVLNYLGDRDALWLMGSPREGPAPIQLVQRAFGRTPIHPPLGVYLEDQVGQSVPCSDDLSVQGHFDPSDRLLAATVVVQGLRFLLWLDPSAEPDPRMFSPEKAHLHYRPTDITFESGPGTISTLHFS